MLEVTCKQADSPVQENARQEDIIERERRTQALVKAEIGTQRRASAATWGIARNKAAQNAGAERMAQLTADFHAIQTATGVSLNLAHSRSAREGLQCSSRLANPG